MQRIKQYPYKRFFTFGTIEQAMLIVFIVRVLYALSIEPYSLLADSSDYINFPLSAFFQGDFSGGRTPVYPIIIRVCYFIFGEALYLQAVVALQSITSFCSVFLFYKVCKLCLKQDFLSWCVTVLYGISPAIHNWDNCILTESFALSGMICFLYLIIRYIQTPSFRLGLATIVLLFVLTFLRPTFLLFDVLVFVFWIARACFHHNEWKLSLKLSLCSGAAFLLIFGYACIFYQTYGFLSISHTMPRQYLTVNITRGYYLDSNYLEFTEKVTEALEASGGDITVASPEVLYYFGLPKISEITNDYIAEHRLSFAFDTLTLAVEISEGSFSPYYTRKTSDIALPLVYLTQMLESALSIFRMSHVYAAILIECIVMLALWIQRKMPPWIHIGLFVFLTAITASSLMATSSEYPRTMICVLPLLYLIFALLWELLRDWLVPKLTSKSADC